MAKTTARSENGSSSRRRARHALVGPKRGRGAISSAVGETPARGNNELRGSCYNVQGASRPELSAAALGDRRMIMRSGSDPGRAGILVTENLRQTRAGAIDAALDGADGTTADFGRFFVRKSLCADEQQCLALIRRQRRKCRPEVGEIKMPVLLRQRCKGVLILIVGIVDLAAQFPMLRKIDVAQNGEEPSAEVRARLERFPVRSRP